MKKKTKLVSIIVSFCLMLTLLLTGVFALRNTTVPMGGSINFTADGMEVTISNGTLENAKLSETATDSTNLKTPAELGKFQDIVFSTDKTLDNHKDNIPTWTDLFMWVSEGETEVTISFDITNHSSKTVYVEIKPTLSPQDVTITKTGSSEIAAKSGATGVGEHYEIIFSITSEYDITNAAFTIDISLGFEPQSVALQSFQPNESNASSTSTFDAVLSAAGVGSQQYIKELLFTKSDSATFEQIRNREWAVYSLEKDVAVEDSKILGFYHIDSATTFEITSTCQIKAPTNCAYMFKGFYATTYDFSNFDTSDVTNMCGMFSSCLVESLDLSGFDTSNVTNMANMFDVSNIKDLNISGFDTSKVEDMSSMFSVSQVEDLDLSNFVTPNLTNTRLMFCYCLNLKTLDLSNMDFSKVTDVTDMFDDCPSLQTVYVKDAVAKTLIEKNDARGKVSIK